jgi:hypothetical protein
MEPCATTLHCYAEAAPAGPTNMHRTAPHRTAPHRIAFYHAMPSSEAFDACTSSFRPSSSRLLANSEPFQRRQAGRQAGRRRRRERRRGSESAAGAAG